MKETTKVLFIIEGLFGGGAEKALIELLKRMDYTLYEVTLCVVFGGGIYTKEVPSQVKLFHLFGNTDNYLQTIFKKKALRHYKKYGRTWLMKFLIWSKCRCHCFDTIVSFIEGYPIVFHSLICKWATRNISWVHCDLRHQHWTTIYYNSDEAEKQCYQKMDKIIFVSSNAMKSFGELYQLSIPQECIYNIVDVDDIRTQALQIGINRDKLTVTSIGSLYKVKGYDRLMRVAKLFRENGYSLHFQILGCGEELENLTRMRDEWGLQESVSFLGFKKNPYPYLKQSDVFVSTSLSEGLPFVICEAFALGIPVVATKTSGAMELLQDGKYGVLVDHDESSIYKGIKALIDDRLLRAEYSKKAQERSDIFNVDAVMQQVYSLLKPTAV